MPVPSTSDLAQQVNDLYPDEIFRFEYSSRPDKERHYIFRHQGRTMILIARDARPYFQALINHHGR
jgi:hypothetical protein